VVDQLLPTVLAVVHLVQFALSGLAMNGNTPQLV